MLGVEAYYSNGINTLLFLFVQSVKILLILGKFGAAHATPVGSDFFMKFA